MIIRLEFEIQVYTYVSVMTSGIRKDYFFEIREVNNGLGETDNKL